MLQSAKAEDPDQEMARLPAEATRARIPDQAAA